VVCHTTVIIALITDRSSATERRNMQSGSNDRSVSDLLMHVSQEAAHIARCSLHRFAAYVNDTHSQLRLALASFSRVEYCRDV
jgi:hypothetical protein